MAIYLVAGKLGAGKTLACVGVIREALREGRRVATNLDLNLIAMLSPRAGGPGRPVSCVRIPDKPDVCDLEALGCGNDEMDEERNGVIVLDELGSWLNSRTFNDKARSPVIDWLIHSRKHGWDVYFICQHLEQIDKQVRQSLVEYLVTCRRLDRLKIPFVGKLIKALSSGFLSGNLPKVHVAVVRYGVEQQAPIADRWVFRARELYGAYNTRQVFSADYAHGVFSYVPPWYFGGAAYRSALDRLGEWWRGVPPRVVEVPKVPLVALIQRLPEKERVRHWRNFDRLGAFESSASSGWSEIAH